MVVRDKLEHETGIVEWRLYWVLAVVLLRAVGHVLDKVDGASDPRVKRLAGIRYKSWRRGTENAIFRDFIEPERNNILKQYAPTISHGPVPIVAHLQAHDGFDLVRQFLIEENLYRPINAGTYEGEDGRALIDEAISWWVHQLSEIVNAIAD